MLGQESPPAFFLGACAIFGIAFLSLTNTLKQHQYQDRIVFACAVSGLLWAFVSAKSLDVLPAALCKTIPWCLLAGQAFSMIVGRLLKVEDDSQIMDEKA